MNLKALDKIISLNKKIHFIKIDVEGGEFEVLKGAKKLLKLNKPLVLFEFGKGASDYYGTTPLDLFNFISNEVGLKIYTLQSFIKNKQPTKEDEFVNYYNTNEEYYFVASVGE